MPIEKVDGGWRWGKHGKVYPTREQAERQAAAAHANGFVGDSIEFAMDKSARFYDADGRLHVRISHISKATVNPYRGSEIPNWEGLNLDPDRIYYLLRDPAELAKGAHTFNNIQILSEHIGVSAADPKKQHTIGSTGTDAAFNDPYLDNSLVFWDKKAIEDIETERKRELSCSYRYTPDMTPGTYQGLPYDGVMRNIIANHVALVFAGRAGHDVLVGDSFEGMGMRITSRKALMVQGALAAHVLPVLAADKAIDLEAVLQGVTRDNFTASKPTILARLERSISGKLAADAKPADLLKAAGLALDAAEKVETGEDDDLEAEDEEEEESEEERKAREEREAEDRKAKDKRARDRRARDEGEESEEERKKREEKEAEDKKASDAALVQRAEDAAMERFMAIRQAEKDVRPYVGELQNPPKSAAEVYKFALDELKVDVSGVPESGYAAVLKALPVPGSTPQPRRANDEASASAMGKFPALAGIRNA